MAYNTFNAHKSPTIVMMIVHWLYTSAEGACFASRIKRDIRFYLYRHLFAGSPGLVAIRICSPPSAANAFSRCSFW